jgi:hypothetical protein
MSMHDAGNNTPSVLADESERLLPCPFCGGPVKLELTHARWTRDFGRRQFWGVVCRNTANIGGTCCMEQVPSASKEAAIGRWNMRNGVRSENKFDNPLNRD